MNFGTWVIRKFEQRYNLANIHYNQNINEMIFTLKNTSCKYWSDGEPTEWRDDNQNRYLCFKYASWVIIESYEETTLYTTAESINAIDQLLNKSEEAKEYLKYLAIKRVGDTPGLLYCNGNKVYDIRFGNNGKKLEGQKIEPKMVVGMTHDDKKPLN